MRYERTKQGVNILKLVYGSNGVYKMSIIKGDAVGQQTKGSI